MFSPAREVAVQTAPVAATVPSSGVGAETDELSPPPKPLQSVRQPIRDALAGDDPFASAARLLAWLQTTTVETFRKLAEEPEKFPSPYFSGFDQEFRSAYFEAIAERWMALDPDNALVAMQRIDQALEKQDYSGDFLRAAAKLRPELILEKLPLENKGGYLEAYTHAALGSLAARDMKAARLVAEHCTDASLRKDAYTAISMGVARNDPLAAVALASEMKQKDLCTVALRGAERIGSGMIRQVLQAAGDQLEPDAISPDFVLQHPDLAMDLPSLRAPKNTAQINEQTLAASDRLAPEERAHLLANCESLPGSARDAVVAALASTWARTEPKEAAEWALAHGKPEEGANSANNAAQQVFLRWINNDADAALAWWRALPDSSLRDALGTNGSTYLAEDGRIDEALEIFRPSVSTNEEAISRSQSPGGVYKKVSRGSTREAAATAQLAQFLVDHDPKLAADWVATLPPAAVTDQTARTVVSEWYERSPEEVAHWIEKLPPSTGRDQAARVFIEEAVQQSPAAAAEWVETVRDPVLRRKAAEWVFWEMRSDDPAAARQWLKTLSGVDEEWQARMLRRWQ